MFPLKIFLDYIAIIVGQRKLKQTDIKTCVESPISEYDTSSGLVNPLPNYLEIFIYMCVHVCVYTRVCIYIYRDYI